MLRCFSSLGCPEASLDEVMDLAAGQDIPCVELRTLGGTTDLAGYLARQFGSPQRLADHLRARHPAVRIAALDGSLRLIGGTDTDRRALIDLAEWACALGVPRLRVFDGGRLADEGELHEAASTVAWWRTERARHGWAADIMVETHDSLLTAAAIRRFVAAVPGTAILWDSHHTWRKGGEDPVATWRAIRGHVVHIHVKDGTGAPSARHPFTYVLPGDGEFSVAPLLAALRADGYAGCVSLEWEKQWHSYLPPLERALEAAAARGWW